MSLNKSKNLYDISALGKVGEDVFISPLVSITRPELVKLGNHIAIDPWLHCTTALETGDYVHISSHVGIIGGKTGLLKLGNFTNISIKGTIICTSDEFLGEGLITAPGIPEKFLDKRKSGPIVFEDFVNTGANVTILPGVTLREGSVIGACSLVTKDTEPWTIYAGIPARPIKIRSKEKMLRYAEALGYPRRKK
jgi:galactoside O-acetyltransferase